MKFVPKINTDGIKQFFINNVEKIAMFFGAVCVVIAAWFALRQETLKDDRQPPKLRADTETARRTVTEAGHAKLPVHDYMDEVATGNAHGELASYAFASNWNSPVKEERVKRGLPTLLSIEKPRAAPGYGAFAIRKAEAPKRSSSMLVAPPPPRPKKVHADGTDPNSPMIEVPATITYNAPISSHGHPMGSDAVPVGFRWVCVTGMIPVTQQEQLFAEKFKKAMKVPNFDASRDKPKWLWYKYEREEMAPDGTVTASDVDQTQTLAAWRETKKWESNSQDIIPSEYVMTTSNQAIGPLTGALGPLLLKDWDARVSHPDIIAAVAAAAAEAERQRNPGVSNDTTLNVGGTDEMPVEQPEVKPSGPKVITHKLFRCFDFTVEPEKKYRYRVSLMFDNPNYIDERDAKNKANVKFIETPQLAKDKYVFSEPSEWTDWITIPPDNRVLIASVKPGRAGGEPMVTVRAVSWDQADGVDVSKEFDMFRGDVAEWIGVRDKVQYLDPNDRLIKPLLSFDFTPRIMLLDLRGGGLAGNNGPLQVLFSDMRGNVFVRTDEEDKAELKIQTDMLTPSDSGSVTVQVK